MRQVINEDALEVVLIDVKESYIMVITTAIRRTLHAVIAFLPCMTEQIHLTLPSIIVVINERGAEHAIAYDSERPANVRCRMGFQIMNAGHYQWKDIC